MYWILAFLLTLTQRAVITIRFRIGSESNGTWVGRKYVQGLVELNSAGIWSPVCAVSFDNSAGNVTCRMLGYASGESNVRYNKFLSTWNNQFIKLGSPKCTGFESDINQCPNSSNNKCKKYSVYNELAIGVRCFYDNPSPTCATHRCPRLARCYIWAGRPNCRCRSGFNLQGSSCIDVNECGRNTTQCSSNADCYNSYGSYRCICKRGFVGDQVKGCKRRYLSSSSISAPVINGITAGVFLIAIVVFTVCFKRFCMRGRTVMRQGHDDNQAHNTVDDSVDDFAIRRRDISTEVSNNHSFDPPPSYSEMLESDRTGEEIEVYVITPAPSPSTTAHISEQPPSYDTLYPHAK